MNFRDRYFAGIPLPASDINEMAITGAYTCLERIESLVDAKQANFIFGAKRLLLGLYLRVCESPPDVDYLALTWDGEKPAHHGFATISQFDDWFKKYPGLQWALLVQTSTGEVLRLCLKGQTPCCP
jgi:hypothetical protein